MWVGQGWQSIPLYLARRDYTGAVSPSLRSSGSRSLALPRTWELNGDGDPVFRWVRNGGRGLWRKENWERSLGLVPLCPAIPSVEKEGSGYPTSQFFPKGWVHVTEGALSQRCRAGMPYGQRPGTAESTLWNPSWETQLSSLFLGQSPGPGSEWAAGQPALEWTAGWSRMSCPCRSG